MGAPVKPANVNKYAIILGAGASYASWVGDQTPPLDGDFLRTAKQYLCGRGRKAPDAAWTRLIKSLKSAGLPEAFFLKQKLEQLSTYLEARANMPSLQHSAGRPATYKEALANLTDVICRTLVATNGMKPCELHRHLFRFVDPTCIVSFNYDLIADQTLLKLKRLAWHHKEYCGNSLLIAPPGHRNRRRISRPQLRAKNAIPLLKLHGSMNWEGHQRGTGHSLLADERPNSEFKLSSFPNPARIVPPVAAKMTIQSGPLRDLWQTASRELRVARGWIIWGYSFPTTDTVTQVLCRTALGRNRRPKPVVIINPDATVAERISTALSNKVKITQYSSVERFLLHHGRIKI